MICDLCLGYNWIPNSKLQINYPLLPVISDWDLIGHFFNVQLVVKIKNLDSLPPVICHLWMLSDWKSFWHPIEYYIQNYKLTTFCDLWTVTGIQLDVSFLSNWIITKIKVATICDLWPVTRIQFDVWCLKNWILNSKMKTHYPLWPVTCDLWPVTYDWDAIGYLFHVQLDIKIKTKSILPSVTCDL